MKLKLLITTSTFPRWSNDTDPPFVYELAKRLTDTFEITVHAPYYPGAKKDEEMDGFRVCRFRYFFQKYEILAGSAGILPKLKSNRIFYGLIPFFIFFQFISLFFLVRSTKPDVIHAHWIIPQGFFSTLIGRITGVPVVVTAHGADVFDLDTKFLNLFKRFTLKNIAAVTVVSKALADHLKRTLLPSIQPCIIPMGVNSSIFTPTKKCNSLREKYEISGTFLLFVGRLTEKKGVHYLLEAMPLVLQDDPSIKLLIAGGGEIESELKTKTIDLAINSNVHFTGSLPNNELPMYYATADIFIGPSIRTESGDTEGFGLTFVEAAMSGCLLIGTDVGGISDIIEHEKTGYLVPEKDCKALADCIIAAKNNIKLTNKMIALSMKKCVSRYDWDVIARIYGALLKTVAETNRNIS